MKTHILMGVVFLLMGINVAFAQDTDPTLAITSQPLAVSIAQKDQSVTLTCTAVKGDAAIAYQWFKNTDNKNTGGTAIPDATAAGYTTDPFTVKEIRYYYCVATVGTESVTSNVAVAAYTGLPTVYVNTGDVPTASITKAEYVLGDFKLVADGADAIEYEFKKVIDGENKEGIKGRGNSSWSQPKKGYNLKFDKKQVFFELPASKKWCLVANHSDKTLLRNKYASVLGHTLYNSQWNPTLTSVDWIMNGVYMGNYTFCEKISLEDGRVAYQDISDCTEAKITKGSYTDQNGDGNVDLYDGGFVLEVDARLDADFYFTTTRGVKVTLKEPDEVDETAQQHVKNIVQAAENALYSNNFTGSDNWRNYFDEDAAIDWYIMNEFTKNNDAKFFSSVYIRYNPADGKLYMGPNWDFDISCGNINYNNCDKTDGYWIKNAAWIKRMFQDPTFAENVKNRWNATKDALLQTLADDGLIQNLADANAVSCELNFMKWQILGKYVWPNAAGYANRKTYQSEIDYMRNWLSERYVWLDNAFNGRILTVDLPSLVASKTYDGNNLASYTADAVITSQDVIADGDDVSVRVVSAVYNSVNTDAKTITVTFELTGTDKDKYAIETRKNYTGKILPLSIENENVALSSETFNFDGSEHNPTVSVKIGTKTLTANTDYTTTLPDGRINTGDYTVTITGKGNYGGTVKKTFTITPAVETIGAITTTTDQDGTSIIIDGNSAESVSIGAPITANTVTYKRNFKAGITATVMLPFEVSTAGIKGSFYTLTNITPDESNIWTISTADAPSKLSANTPYLFKPSEDIAEMVFENVDLVATADGYTTFGGKGEWKFQGVYTLKEWAQRTPTDYGFAAADNTNNDGIEIEAGQFVRAGENSKMKPTRAYLTYDESKTLSKSTTTLPDKIIVLFPDASDGDEIEIPVAENDGDFLTPISEAAPNAGVKVWSYEKTIFIEGREGMQYSIVDIGGRRIMHTTTKSDREEIHLNGNPTGIMIVRVAGKSFKVMY